MAQVEKTRDGFYKISGQVDFSNVMQLLRQLQKLSVQERNLSIDMSGVEKSNSAGLGLLMELLSLAKQTQQVMVFTGIPDTLMDLARMSNIEHLLNSAA